VANEVETEQIVTDADGKSYGKGVLTSLVQVRGSIPLFWQHTNLMSPKPGIVLDPCDPSYIATRAHFKRLQCRYGDGIVVLSLINQVDGHRETKLGEAFTHVVSVLNASPGESSADSTATATGVEGGGEQEGGGETKCNDTKDKGVTGDTGETDDANGTDDGAARTEKGIRTDSIYMSNGSELCPSEPLMYITFDFAACSKSTTQNVIEAVSAVSDSMQSKIGFFRTSRPVGKGHGSSWSEGVQAVRQAGILRSNCIDCKMQLPICVIPSLLCFLLGLQYCIHTTRTTTHNMSHAHAHSQSNLHDNAHALTQLILTLRLLPYLVHLLYRRLDMPGLDRTNVAQFCLGRSSLPSQFAALGVRLREEQFDIVWTKLMDAFATHGDEMARQYGGSGAMHRIALEGGGSARASGSAESDSNASQPKAAVTGGVKNALVATKRYLANNLSDPLKQQGLDLFLGVYRCEPGKQALWDSAQVNEKGAIEIASGSGAPYADGTNGANATDTDRSVSSTDDNIGLTVIREFDDAVPTREIERGEGGEKTEAKSAKGRTKRQARAGALGCFYDEKYELDCLTSFDGIMEKRNERVRVDGPSLSSLEVAVSSPDDASSTISDDPGSPHSVALESNGALRLDEASLLLDPLPFVASGGDSNCHSPKSARAAYEQYVGGTASFGPASASAPSRTSQPTTRTSQDSGAHGAREYGAEFDEDNEQLVRDTIDSESSFSVCHDDERLGSVGAVGGGGRQNSSITPSSPLQNRVDRADKSSEEQGNLPSTRHTGKGIFSRLFGRKKHREVPRSEEPSGGYGGGEPTPRVARVSEDNMPSSLVSLDDVDQFSIFADQMRRLELLNVATDERLRHLTLLCERQDLSCTAMQAMVAKDVIPPTQDSKPAAVPQRRVGGALFTQLDRINNN
jgi:hypothetical protein